MSNIPPYRVYGLIDPRNQRVFYVGMSYILLDRIVSHNTDKKGAAYALCQEIISAGYKPKHCVFGTFEDGSAAAFLEAQLITAIPNLLNRTHKQEHRDLWRRFEENGGEEGEIALECESNLDAIDVMMSVQ